MLLRNKHSKVHIQKAVNDLVCFDPRPRSPHTAAEATACCSRTSSYPNSKGKTETGVLKHTLDLTNTQAAQAVTDKHAAEKKAATVEEQSKQTAAEFAQAVT
jgi:hypothetical protein